MHPFHDKLQPVVNQILPDTPPGPPRDPLPRTWPRCIAQEYIRSAYLSFKPFSSLLHNMRRFSQDPEDKVLWALTSIGGKADRSYLRRRLDMKLAELETALVALESEKRIKRTDFEEKGKTNQMITLA